jgi:hypothetical protein
MEETEVKLPDRKTGATIYHTGNVNSEEAKERLKKILKERELRRLKRMGIEYAKGGFVETRGEGKAIRHKKTRMF